MEKRTSPLLWAVLIAILLLACWEYLRKHPAAQMSPPEKMAESTPADGAKSPSVPPPSVLTPAASASSPATATKDLPFVNSLGMKFVSVPGTEVLFCIHETRYRDFAAYSVETRGLDGAWKNQSCDGYTPTNRAADHPVMRVNWEEAQGFCTWLSRKEGKAYRLPTDREWSLAVGIGNQETWKTDTTPVTVFKSQTDFPWGGQWPPPQGSGNYSDESRKAKAPIADTKYIDGYDDGFPTTAPVMSFKPNPFGIYDLEGNVREWCADSYDNANKERVLRGGLLVLRRCSCSAIVVLSRPLRA